MAKIFYFSLRDEQPRQDKLTWFAATKFKNVVFEQITPDEKHNWINLTDNNWDSLMPVCDKNVKAGKSNAAIFKLYSQGIKTNRDGWVYDFNINTLQNKIKYLILNYNQEVDKLSTSNISKADIANSIAYEIKWTRYLKKLANNRHKLTFNEQQIRDVFYRPFINKKIYFGKELNEDLYQINLIFKSNFRNKAICMSGVPSNKPFQTFAVEKMFDYHFLEDSQCLPLFTYDAHGNQVENITDWALAQFRAKYGASCSKLDIFHYIYAVLHHPTYRQTYEQNLKRDFPRVPLYDDLAQWAAWGKALLDLHIEYETAEPYALQRVDVLPKSKKKKDESLFAETTVEPLFETPRPTIAPKTKLRADKELGEIQLDEQTKLTGIPPQAWAYKLGNRSALEWILDQYKESTPSDPTIREQFNTYRFADYKDHVIDLLCRVCTVSVQTMNIISQMPS